MNCNIHCDHCFVPKIDNELSNDDLKRIVDFINFQNEDDFINITFHGGEPTMVGTTRLKEILDYFIENIKPEINYKFDIQTNLVILNKELIKIFKEYFQFIGISYDVNIRHVKGGNFEDIFFKNLQIIKDNNIEYNAIITLTQEVLNLKPIKFYTFLKNNFKNVHIEKLTHDGEAIKNWKYIGVNNKEYSNYMIELFKIYSIDNLNKEYFNISPFDALCQGFIKNTNYSCRGMCGNFFSFGPNYFSGACTALNAGFKKDSTPKDIVVNNLKFVKEINAKTKHICEGCDFITICGEGCPSGKNEIVDESGECRGSKELLRFIKDKLSNSITLRNHFSEKQIQPKF